MGLTTGGVGLTTGGLHSSTLPECLRVYNRSTGARNRDGPAELTTGERAELATGRGIELTTGVGDGETTGEMGLEKADCKLRGGS